MSLNYETFLLTNVNLNPYKQNVFL